MVELETAEQLAARVAARHAPVQHDALTDRNLTRRQRRLRPRQQAHRLVGAAAGTDQALQLRRNVRVEIDQSLLLMAPVQPVAQCKPGRRQGIHQQHSAARIGLLPYRKTQRREQERQRRGDQQQPGALGRRQRDAAVQPVRGQQVGQAAPQHRLRKLIGHPMGLLQRRGNQVAQQQDHNAAERPDQQAPLLARGGRCQRAVSVQIGQQPRRRISQLGVTRQQRLDHLRRTELLRNTLARRLTQAQAQTGIARQRAQAIGQHARLVRHQHAMDIVRDQLAQAGQIAGDHRQTGVHRLEHRNRQALMIRHQHKDGVLRQLLRHIGHIAGEAHLLQAQLLRQRLLHFELRTVADQRGRQLVPQTLAQQGQCLQQQVGPLRAGHARDHHDAQRLLQRPAAALTACDSVENHADTFRRNRQLAGQLALVLRHAHHVAGERGQCKLGQPGSPALQRRDLRLEAETVHGIDHRQIGDAAGDARHHAGHRAVCVYDVGLLFAQQAQQGAHRGQHAQRRERIAELWQRAHRHS